MQVTKLGRDNPSKNGSDPKGPEPQLWAAGGPLYVGKVGEEQGLILYV